MGRPYILVIDDSKNDLRRQKSFVESRWEEPIVLTFHFTKPSDFETVCSIIANTPELSAIVTDIRLPGYPGNGGIISELRNFLNQIGRVLPIVALSNYPPRNVLQYGADAGVAKGDKEEFLSTLASFVAGKEAEDLEQIKREILELKRRGEVLSLSMTKLYTGIQDSYGLMSLRVKGLEEIGKVDRAESIEVKKTLSELALQLATCHSEIILLQNNAQKLDRLENRVDRYLRSRSYYAQMPKTLVAIVTIGIVSLIVVLVAITYLL